MQLIRNIESFSRTNVDGTIPLKRIKFVFVFFKRNKLYVLVGKISSTLGNILKQREFKTGTQSNRRSIKNIKFFKKDLFKIRLRDIMKIVNVKHFYLHYDNYAVVLVNPKHIYFIYFGKLITWKVFYWYFGPIIVLTKHNQ